MLVVRVPCVARLLERKRAIAVCDNNVIREHDFKVNLKIAS